MELLARHGLLTKDSAGRVSKWTTKQVYALHEQLWERIYRQQYAVEPKNDDAFFRFVPSSSLRGDTCPYCRSEKLDFLGRFAVLYSDQLILPLPLEKPSRVKSSVTARRELQQTVESLLHLEPLINAGIVAPAVMTTTHCEHKGPVMKKIIELTHFIAEGLAEEHLDKFTMYYEPNIGTGNPPALHIDSPADYVEHGGVIIEYPDPPKWVAKSWRTGPDGRIRVPLAKVRRTGWIHSIFERIATGTTFHIAYGAMWQAKFLTDLPGEAEILRELTCDGEPQDQATNLFAALTHSLPFINELPTTEMLKLRKKLAESFQQYRWAVTSIIRQHGRDRTLTPADAKEIYNDVLAPRIAALENRAAVERERLATKFVSTLGLTSIVVTLGLFDLLTPSQALAMLGGAATMKLADHLSEAASPTLETATQDLYFLLRLK